VAALQRTARVVGLFPNHHNHGEARCTSFGLPQAREDRRVVASTTGAAKVRHWEKALRPLIVSGLLFGAVAGTANGQSFTLEEATIASVHAAFERGELTCTALVQAYLDRIEALDQATELNAIVVTHPDAVSRAEELDAAYAQDGPVGPMHCVPMIVKDNYDTFDLQTAGGSKALEGFTPPDDAYQVRVLREAGAIVLAKSNMAEWAFSPYQTVSSIAGTTRNAYDLERVPAGSSGGTASAVAANFGLVGLGTDTGNSIRGPSSHLALVGIRSTLGLTSRDGIIPLYLNRDVGGPMVRTVEDAVKILGLIAGYDPADPLTLTAIGRTAGDYTAFLDADGLAGARIGVMRAISDTDTADPEILALFNQALADMEAAGAVLVDPFEVPDFATLREDVWCNTLRYDLDIYLANTGDPPYDSLQAIYDSSLYSGYIKERMERSLELDMPPGEQEPPCTDLYTDPRRVDFRAAVEGAMDEGEVDVVVYPSWSNPPRLVDDLGSPHGNNSPIIAPHTGQPAMTVPMGFTEAGLPAGLQILARMFDEEAMIRVAYAYEQVTMHRRPPEGFGPLE
jgi:Asp-tRNA(Asn)/Glu-tRNA(Gln) amidotransferase A subunit family amidase